MKEEVEQFERLVAQYEAAWNRHDAKELASLFTFDAEFVNVAGLWWRGRDQIEAAYLSCHARAFRSSELRLKLSNSKMVCAEAATAVCEWDVTGQRSSDNTILPTRPGIMTMVLTQNFGRWLIAGAQNNYKCVSRRELEKEKEAE